MDLSKKTPSSTVADDQPHDWPQFRGPDGQGHASTTGLPLQWNAKRNVTWKVPIRGHGWSSPVVGHERIWLTSAVAAEKSLRLLCLDAKTGKTLSDMEIFHVREFGGIHSKNSHATPTPVLFRDRCLVHFGSHGTAAVDLQNNLIWKTKLEYFHHHGPAGSPALADGAAILVCDGMTFSFYDDRKIENLLDPQFIVALDLETGKIRWKTSREGTHSYVTPLVIQCGEATQIIAPGGNRVIAYEPQTGKEIWSCRYQGYSLVPRPVFGHGLVFVCTGYDSPSLLAIRPDGQGDITDTHVVWKFDKGVPFMSSPILVGDELYMVSHLGVVSCLDAKSGKLHWKNRIGGNHSSSPVFADGRLYFLDESGTTQVLEPGLKFKLLSKNILPGRTQSSMAVGSRAFFIRNDTHLYRIEESVEKPSAASINHVKDETVEEEDETGEKSNEKLFNSSSPE